MKLKITTIFSIFVIGLVALAAGTSDLIFRLGPKTDTTSERQIIMTDNNLIRTPPGGGDIEFSNDAGISFKKIGSGAGGGSGVNVLVDSNFDFESGNPPASWTASGGTFVGASPGLFDNQSGQWDSDALGQTLCSEAVLIEPGFIGNSCQSEFKYRWPTGVEGDLLFKVIFNDGADVEKVSLPLRVTPVGETKPAVAVFDCPTTDTTTMQLCLESTIANADPITVDNAFLGSGRNTVQAVPKNEIETKILSADVTSDGVVADLTFTDLQIGTVYEITGQYTTTVEDGANDAGVSLQALNGAQVINLSAIGINTDNILPKFNSWGVIGKFEATADTLTFTAASASAESRIDGDGTRSQTFIQLEKRNDLGGNFQEGLTLETSGEYWDVNIGGSNPNISTGNVSVYTEITDSSMDLVVNPGSRQAEIPCSGTNPSSGTTCSAGDEGVGIAFDISTSGLYEACIGFGHQLNTDAAGFANTTFQLVETPNNAQTILQEGNTRIPSSIDNDAGVDAGVAINPFFMCSLFSFSEAGKKTLRLMYEQAAGGTITQNFLIGDRSTSNGQRDIHIIVKKIGEQFPTPIFTDLQNSLNSRVQSNVDNTQICSFSTGSTGSSGATDHTNCIASATAAGSATLQVDWIAGNWASGSPYSCTCTAVGSGGVCSVVVKSTSQTNFQSYNFSGTPTNLGIDVTCHGIKGN